MTARLGGRVTHTAVCPFPNSHRDLTVKFDLINKFRIGHAETNCYFLVTPELIVIRPQNSTMRLTGLFTLEWLKQSKLELGNRKLVFQNFSMDWASEKPWDDTYFLEYFYKTYGRENIIGPDYKKTLAHESDEDDYRAFIQRMDEKYPL
jgi:hypothetical protein